MLRRSRFIAQTTAAALAGATVRQAMAQSTTPFALGDDVFVQNAWHELAGRSIGIITNQSGITSQGQSIVDAVRERTQVIARAIFAPEHGFRGDRPAGASVASYIDSRTGLPVYSLYGATRHADAVELSGIEALLFDIQDVGSRAYTYISTMAYAMQTAKARGIPFWVLDRPNPVGGVQVEGPVLQPAFSSFIGLYPIAMRHGMTVGELARLFNDRFGIGCDLRVVSMRGWRRSMLWPETSLHWIRTSPNVPTWQTTFVLLCTGLVDNAGINNGVGTDTPFFYAGTLGLDGSRLADALNTQNLPGVTFDAAQWSPKTGFWKNHTLSGVRLTVVDAGNFLPAHTAVALLATIRQIAPRAIAVKDPAALDRDWGTDSLRLGLLHGLSADEIISQWAVRTIQFQALRSKYLLYP
jgi:uncharacterized protein YbbC (DUF1343 family)